MDQINQVASEIENKENPFGMFAINNMLGAVIKVQTGHQTIKVYKHLLNNKNL